MNYDIAVVLSFDDDFNVLGFPTLLECFDDLELLGFRAEFDF